MSSLSWPRFKHRASQLARTHTTAVMFAGAVLVSAVLFATAPTPTPVAVEEKAWPVSVVTATPQSLRPSFRAYGRVESRNQADLITDLSALIKKVHVKEGDRVTRGSLLVSLDERELALEVASREAELLESGANVRSIASELEHIRSIDAEHSSVLKVSEAKLSRHKKLLRERLISRGLFDEVLRQSNAVRIDFVRHNLRLQDLPNRLQAAQALKDRAQARLELARINLTKTQLLAPFDGIVIAVPAAVGSRAQPGTTLLQLADANAFEVRVPVPPAHSSAFLMHGPSALTPTTIEAKLSSGIALPYSRLAGAVKPGQAGAEALFSWQQVQSQPAPVGTTVELQISLPVADNVIALPAQALYENERVYRVRDGRLQPVVVDRVGELHDEGGSYQVLIRATGLKAGDQVVSTALPKAMPGLKVATIESHRERHPASAAGTGVQGTGVQGKNAEQIIRAPRRTNKERTKSDTATSPRLSSRRYRML